MQLLVFCITPFLLMQNAGTLLDILCWQHEPYHKTNVVRLLGTHSAKFIVLCSAGLIFVNGVVDTQRSGNSDPMLAYLPFALWILNTFMEEKQENLRASRWFAVVLVFGHFMFGLAYLSA